MLKGMDEDGKVEKIYGSRRGGLLRSGHISKKNPKKNVPNKARHQLMGNWAAHNRMIEFLMRDAALTTNA